jgi:hypothetical protein
MAQELIEETYGYAKQAGIYQMVIDFPFAIEDRDLTHHLMALFLDFHSQVEQCFEEEGEEAYNVNMDFERFKINVGQNITDFWWDMLGKPFNFYENSDQAIYYPYEEYTRRLKKYSMETLYNYFRYHYRGGLYSEN